MVIRETSKILNQQSALQSKSLRYLHTHLLHVHDAAATCHVTCTKNTKSSVSDHIVARNRSHHRNHRLRRLFGAYISHFMRSSRKRNGPACERCIAGVCFHLHGHASNTNRTRTRFSHCHAEDKWQEINNSTNQRCFER